MSSTPNTEESGPLINNYLEKATELMRLANQAKELEEKINTLELELADYWPQMTIEEQMYVDEQTVRIGQFL